MRTLFRDFACPQGRLGASNCGAAADCRADTSTVTSSGGSANTYQSGYTYDAGGNLCRMLAQDDGA